MAAMSRWVGKPFFFSEGEFWWRIFFHKKQLGGGFTYFLFSSLPGEMIQFDEHIFQMGWNHQLDKEGPEPSFK